MKKIEKQIRNDFFWKIEKKLEKLEKIEKYEKPKKIANALFSISHIFKRGFQHIVHQLIHFKKEQNFLICTSSQVSSVVRVLDF